MHEGHDLIEDNTIDESVWVPHGEEVVPAILFANKHVVANGGSFVSNQASLVDRLLQTGRMDPRHHHTAVRINRLAQSALSKQGYTVSKVFSPTPPGGYDNSEYCPMTMFMRLTRRLNPTHLLWIHVVCGLRNCDLDIASQNLHLIHEALDLIEKRFEELAPKDQDSELQHYAEGSI